MIHVGIHKVQLTLYLQCCSLSYLARAEQYYTMILTQGIEALTDDYIYQEAFLKRDLLDLPCREYVDQIAIRSYS
jgi:hypothetical protein